MNKHNKFNFKKAIIIITIVIIIMVLMFCTYTNFYYKKISVSTIEKHFIVCSNIFLKFVSKVLNDIVNSVLNKDTVKVIIIAFTIIIACDKFDLKSMIDRTSNWKLEFQGLKMEVDASKALKAINKQEEEKAEELTNTKSDNECEVKEQLDLTTKKLEIIKVLSNNPFLLNILERGINKKHFKVSIPFYVFGEKTSIDATSKIFDYILKDNTIEITGIKNEIKDIIYDLYIEIKKESGTF